MKTPKLNYSTLHHIIARRDNIDDEDDEALEAWRTQLATFLTEDISGTVEWLETDCTREQFEWLSELFDKILARSQDSRLVQALVETCDRLIPDEDTYHVREMLQMAIFGYCNDSDRDRYLRRELLSPREWNIFQQEKAAAASCRIHEEQNPLF
ncbi:hypothetical protein ACLUWO_07975 [Pseudoscardovia radai]|uniref:hypothetical protein n=1 Tax=Pseudoscardovia radai TaxID=987066 RepID=UPI0039914CEB